MISDPIGKSSITLISHNVTLDNLVYRKRLRFIKTLNKLTLHLLREDWFGWLWDGDGSLDFATITQRH